MIRIKRNVRKGTAVILAGLMIVVSLTICIGAQITGGNPKPHDVEVEKIPVSGPVTDLLITAGKDESSLNLTWHGYSSSNTYVQWAQTDELVNGEFTDNCSIALAVNTNGTLRTKMSVLKSDTEYAYRVGSNESGWSPIYTVKTGKFDDGAFSFLLAGDPQVGCCTPDIDALNWSATLRVAREWFGDDIEFLLTAGDQVNSGDSDNEWNIFAYPEWLRSLPLVSLPGNHDNEPFYSRYFTYDDVDHNSTGRAGEFGGDYWVAHDGCLFVILNCVDQSEALHRAFIERAIAEYTEIYGKPNWKIAALHYSTYSGAEGRWDSNYPERFSPIFSGFGFDAVLSGHDHVYARAYLMNAEQQPLDVPDAYVEDKGDPFGSIIDPDEDRVFYMTANSSSGSKFYRATNKELPWLLKNYQDNIPNVTKVDVTPDMLNFTTYRITENSKMSDVVDFFAIHRRAGVEKDEYAPVLTAPKVTYITEDDIPILMDGVTAYDDFDADLSDKITFSGNVSLNETSVVTYTVTDSAGNVAKAKRTFIPLYEDVCVSTEKSLWKYIDDGEYPFDLSDEDKTAWTRDGYDASGWKEGKAPFGSHLGEPTEVSGLPVATPLNMYYPDDSDSAGENISNFFFLTEFDVKDPEKVNAIRLDLTLDDGADIFINGVRVKRVNVMNGGRLYGYGFAHSEEGASRLQIYIRDKEFIKSLGLKPTGNILGVELYQGVGDSEGIYFDANRISLIGDPEVGFENPFDDVADGKWYTEGVLYCASKGYMNGTGASLFSPGSHLTRAMFVTVLAKIDGAEVGEYTESSFADVAPGKWYTNTVEWAYKNGYTAGIYIDADGKPVFGWNVPVTRQQLAAFFYTYSRKNGYDVSASADLSSYKDLGDVGKWAESAVKWAVGSGLISGTSETALSPRSYATRAQVALIVMNYVKNAMK